MGSVPEAWAAASVGIGGAVLLLFLRWPGWVGLPLSILLLRYGVDAGLSPLLRYEYGWGKLQMTDVTIIGPVMAEDIPRAIGVLTLGYGSVLIGMVLVRLFGASKGLNNVPSIGSTRDYYYYRKAFQGSYLLFGFGIFLYAVALLFAGKGLSLSEIASTRAVFTNREAYGNVLFNYAWLLKDTAQVGAIGMLLFAYRLRKHIRLAWLANFIYLGIQPLFGGRTAIVVGGLVIGMAYHYGIKKLKPLSMALVMIPVMIGLVYVATVRHGHTSIPDAIKASLTQMASTRALEEVAFSLENFPKRVEFYNGSTLIGGIAHAVPGLKLKSAKNLWLSLEERFVNRRTAQGIGGQTMSTTSENYMNFGMPGVILIGCLLGLFFGTVFEWQRRRPNDPIALLIASLMISVFIIAIYKKMALRISDIPIQILLPTAFITAWAAGRVFVVKMGMIFAFVIVGLAAFKLSGVAYLKYISFVAMILLYMYAIQLVTRKKAFFPAPSGPDIHDAERK